MKLQLLIINILKYLVLTRQEEKQALQLNLEGYTGTIDNVTYDYDDSDSAPCSNSVPGFNSLGVMITFIAVFVLSMAGNSVVVYVICSMKRGRSSTDIYLMHLALADLLFCCTLPFWAVDAFSGWIFGNFLCKVLSGFQEASVYGSVFLLACISVDRHIAIVRATQAAPSHHPAVKVVCTLVWLLGGVLALPVVIWKEELPSGEQGQKICYENLTGESGNTLRISVHILHHTMGFFLPLVVMAVCYGWIMVTLCHKRNQQKQKAIRIIMAVVLAFVVCWLPYNVAVLSDTLLRGGSFGEETCDTRYMVEVTLQVTQVLAFMHCAVNPVLYAFIGEKFRNQLLSALYRHGLISKRLHMAYRTGSVTSAGSTRSRNTSTM